jgi:hypothetical protein
MKIMKQNILGGFAIISHNINFQKSVPTTVVTKSGNDRPEIFPHQDFDHPFVKDYYEGITKEEAEKRIQGMLKN